jgi:hypothetical protein
MLTQHIAVVTAFTQVVKVDLPISGTRDDVTLRLKQLLRLKDIPDVLRSQRFQSLACSPVK